MATKKSPKKSPKKPARIAAKRAAKKLAAKKSAKKPVKKLLKKQFKKPSPSPTRAAPRRLRTPSAAFMKPMAPSLALAAIVGAEPLPRTEVTRRLWAYIREHKLQDPQNRRLIRADERLKPVFNGQEAVNMFEMMKLVNQNLTVPSAPVVPAPPVPESPEAPPPVATPPATPPP